MSWCAHGPASPPLPLPCPTQPLCLSSGVSHRASIVDFPKAREVLWLVQWSRYGLLRHFRDSDQRLPGRSRHTGMSRLDELERIPIRVCSACPALPLHCPAPALRCLSLACPACHFLSYLSCPAFPALPNSGTRQKRFILSVWVPRNPGPTSVTIGQPRSSPSSRTSGQHS